MGEIWLVRHGETAWSKTGQHTGRTDLPLTPHGERQAADLRSRLDRPWAAVLSSPSQRAARTAELAGLQPRLEEGLLEWDYGHAEGQTSAELSAAQAGWSVWTDRTMNETVEHVGERAARVLALVAPAVESGDVCLVGHGHALRILAAVWLGLPPDNGRLLMLAPASVSVLGLEHGAAVVVRWNT